MIFQLGIASGWAPGPSAARPFAIAVSSRSFALENPEALASEPVIARLQRVRERRPKNLLGYQRDAAMRLPGL